MSNKDDLEKFKSKIQSQNYDDVQQAIPTTFNLANITRKERNEALRENQEDFDEIKTGEQRYAIEDKAPLLDFD
jgi:hypothetical protein